MHEVQVSYMDRVFETLHIDGADDDKQAEFLALAQVKDSNPDATDVDILEVTEIK